VYNGALPGVPNDCHISSSRIDASYLMEEGRCATYQHDNRLIVSYTPKRIGHRGVQSFRTDVIFGYAAPFDALVVDGKPIHSLPADLPAPSHICICDYQTYVLLMPLPPSPAAGEKPIRLSVVNDFFLISSHNYDGPARDFTREEISDWRSGYFLEVWSKNDFSSWEDFVNHTSYVRVNETVDGRGLRRIIAHGKGAEMEFLYDPFRENTISRKWCGEEERIEHLEVRAAEAIDGPFCPRTLYGSEGFTA
jgi:hypothetical protein